MTQCVRVMVMVLMVMSTALAAPDADRDAAVALVKAGKNSEALAAYVKLAEGAGDETQKSEYLYQAALCADWLKQYEQALSLAGRIPLAPYAKTCRMEILTDSRKWAQVVAESTGEDFSAWPDSVRGNAFRLRGEAENNAGKPELAAADLEKAAQALSDGYWRGRSLAGLGNARQKLKDEAGALEAYRRALADRSVPMLVKCQAAGTAAEILLGQGKPQEALEMVKSVDRTHATLEWPARLQGAEAAALAALGHREEALAAYRQGLKIENLSPARRQAFEAAIQALLGSGNMLVLAEKGKCDYQIVLPQAFPNAEIDKALRDIAGLIQKAFAANGFTVPVVQEDAREAERPGIYLGDTAFARANGVEAAKLSAWGYVHKVAGRNVILAGIDRPWKAPPPEGGWRNVEGRPMLGTAKAATDFLRQYVGTRFLFPTDTGIEFLDTPLISVPAGLNLVHTPVLRYCGSTTAAIASAISPTKPSSSSA